MVKIITDTLAVLPDSVVRQYDIPVIPQIINFGTDSFLEGIEMDNAAFLARLKSDRELPKTAAPPPNLFAAEFERLVPSGESILCIHPSSDLSGTVRSAKIAAADFEADIRVIDTRVIASPLATTVQLAAEWAAAGLDADAIQSRIEALTTRWQVYFMVPTLEYLARGGRIGGAAALVGSMLQIKPILQLRDGRVEQFEKDRTHRRALAHLKQLVFDKIPRNGQAHLSVMHAGVPKEGKALAEELRDRLNLAMVPIFHVPPAVITHAGPGMLGVAFLQE